MLDLVCLCERPCLILLTLLSKKLAWQILFAASQAVMVNTEQSTYFVNNLFESLIHQKKKEQPYKQMEVIHFSNIKSGGYGKDTVWDVPSRVSFHLQKTFCMRRLTKSVLLPQEKISKQTNK